MPITLLQNANEKDAEKIYALTIELVENYEDLASINYESVKKWLSSKIQNELKNYHCIYRGSEKVGYILLKEVNDEIEIDDFYLFEAYRNQGIGTQILKDILNPKNNYFLYVFKKNQGAIRLYERFHFRIDEEVCKTRCIMRCKKSL